MGWIPPTTTFYYGQRSKCADLPELLPTLPSSRNYFKKTLDIFYTHERLDFPFCTAYIARLCNRGCAEIGKS